MALLDQTVNVRREAARQRLLQVGMRKPINLHGDEAGSLTLRNAHGATEMPGQHIVFPAGQGRRQPTEEINQPS